MSVRVLLHDERLAGRGEVRQRHRRDGATQAVGDEVDLALVYDYDLAPAEFDPGMEISPLWTARWSLGVPAAAAPGPAGSSVTVFGRFRQHNWIVDSRKSCARSRRWPGSNR